MSEMKVWTVGNRNPSITENLVLEDNVTPVDLTGKTVKFKARDVGSAALLVDQAATVVGLAAAGNVRYDWSAADIAANGILSAARFPLVWWEVTTTSGGRTQDYNEAQIQVQAHAPGLHSYIELEELKSTAALQDTSFANQDMIRSIEAASRAIDNVTNRRFWSDADTAQIRYYTPSDAWELDVDDLITLTSFKTDTTGDGTFETTWTLNTDFNLEPLNAVADARPWETICRHRNSSLYFPSYTRSVEVTGKFGWAAVPAEVKTATTIIAARLVLRSRQAPFGVVVSGIEGEAIRIARSDPDLKLLLESVTRTQVLA